MAIRDIVLMLLLLGGLPVALRFPFFGICVYAWLGLMNPHRLSWGFAYDFPWAQVYGIVALVSLAWERDRRLLASLARFRILIAFLAWMGVTTLMALEPDRAAVRIVEVLKIYLMAIATLSVLTTERRVRIFLSVAVLSVAFFGVKGGLFTVLGGGNFRVWGPPGSVIEDNNQLAVALTMTVPLMVWMLRVYPAMWARAGLLGAITLVIVAILGTHSRGALLALVAMGLLLIVKSERKAAFAMVFLLGAVLAVMLMPEHFWDRMASIGNYERDKSAYGRFNAWQTALRIADARLTGGGFDYAGVRAFAAFAPDPTDVKSAHSIYFQALGEHGWPGLVLFLAFWGGVWLALRAAIRRHRADPAGGARVALASMIQVSLAGFLVGGAFVNIGYWDFPFYLAAVAFALAALPVGASAPVAADARAGAGAPADPRAARMGPRGTAAAARSSGARAPATALPVAMTRRAHGPR